MAAVAAVARPEAVAAVAAQVVAERAVVAAAERAVVAPAPAPAASVAEAERWVVAAVPVVQPLAVEGDLARSEAPVAPARLKAAAATLARWEVVVVRRAPVSMVAQVAPRAG